jgi:TatD DNase family protein
VFDTHAHLCDPAFGADLPEVLERARAAGVRAIVAVGESLADAERNLELAAAHPELVRPAAGLFPTELDAGRAERLIAWIRAHRDALVAIGEVGLDHWRIREAPDRERQRDLFRRFVDLAIELDLPLNVHSRAAGRATIELLLERGARRVQLHAFDGRAAVALPAAEAGYFFSVPPSVTRSPQKQKLVRRLPLERLLLETDSPVLGPDPGARNEPANVAVSLAAIAELKGLAAEAVREAVAANTRALYGDLESLSGRGRPVG